MTNFFKLPHIFVVFSPGASGNFIAGVITRTLHKDLIDLALSSTGNAHANSTSKLDFSDIISCGFRYGVPKFDSSEEKLQHFKAEIEKQHGNDTDVKISWSHDFSNIPLYKTLFPNCKILVVSHDSGKEKLTALIQQELKNRLDPNGFVFLKNDPYLEQWRSVFKQTLIVVLGQSLIDVATDIANNFMDPKYRPIVTFLAVNMMIRFYEQEHLVDPRKKMMYDYLEYCTVARFDEDPTYVLKNTDYVLFTVGPAYKDCITSDCVVMPYNVIMNNDPLTFVNTIEKITGTLDSEQIEFIKYNLNNYYSKQSPGLMDDPVEYYYRLGREAQHQIRVLKGQ